MASLMENLIDLLNKEADEYQNLLILAKQKTDIIVSGNPDELTASTGSEQLIIAAINKIDKERETIMRDIATVLAQNPDTMKLSDLIATMGNRPDDQKALASARDRLNTTAGQLNIINEQNRSLITNALSMVEFDINLLRSASEAPDTANYSRSAYQTGAKLGSAASFEAKQ